MKAQDAKNHVEKIILPYWNNLLDEENGGFYGFVGNNLKVKKNAEKGVILHSRILWFYSNACLVLKNKSLQKYADSAYKFLTEKCFDKKNGGVFWMMKANGDVKDNTKNAYNQAFAIYGLSSYYRLTKNKDALRHAYELFECIETYCTDQYGYLEAFSVDWKKPVESAICDQGVVADKTMNTLLHVLEAYTELYSVDKHPLVGKKLYHILEIVRDKLYNKDLQRLEVFFDEKMNSISDIHSYGHDIEATWLIDRACEVLVENKEVLPSSYSALIDKLVKQTNTYTSKISKKILDIAYTNNSLNNESRGELSKNPKIDENRIWWVQAETVIGFYNEYQKNGKKAFLEAANAVYDYIEEFQVDKRPGSEWFGTIDKDGKPKTTQEITGPWKCPYHNGRMCFELIKRVK